MGIPPKKTIVTVAIKLAVVGGVIGLLALALDPDGATLEAMVPEGSELPGFTSLLPPLLAIALAVITGKVALSLFAGIWGGASLAAGVDPVRGLVPTVTDYLWVTVRDPFNISVIVFTVMLVGMTGIMVKSGGVGAVIEGLSRFAKTARSTMGVIFAMGLAVFFDDYTNTMIVGSASQRLADKRGISREKLAYIVDSTAAPVAGIALISTWIGVEVDLIGHQLPTLGGIASSGYELFLMLVPYRFYCLFALATVAVVAFLGRDFGPMLRVERAARATASKARGAHEPAGSSKGWWLAVVPVVVVLVAIIVGFITVGASLLTPGMEGYPFDPASITSLKESFILAGDDGMTILAIASVAGTLVALVLSMVTGRLGLVGALGAWYESVARTAPTLVVLVLAITVRLVTDSLDTGAYLAASIEGTPNLVLPVAIFVVSGFTAFSTGTSWGTMGLLLPVVAPLIAQSGDGVIVLLSMGAVLDGAIFGDHCSPISDTTVMSSMAAGTDHISHVVTQAPYAGVSMLVAATMGYLLTAVLGGGGGSLVLSYGLGVALLVIVYRLLGRRPETTPR